MSLHDWSALAGWDGVHQVWIVELLYWIKPRLPAGYRAYIGTTPTFAIGELAGFCGCQSSTCCKIYQLILV